MKLDIPLDIPVNAHVYCHDELCGRLTRVILNPVSKRVTHIVVQDQVIPHIEYLVPMDLVVETTPERLYLRCDQAELARQEPFVDVEFVEPEAGELAEEYALPGEHDVRLWPYVLAQDTIPIEHERIPPGELAVRRGATVQATDGRVGRVDEFLIDPASEHVTHLVLRQGHLWGDRDVTIPVSDIDRVEADEVTLKLSKHQVAALKAVPVHRHWH